MSVEKARELTLAALDIKIDPLIWRKIEDAARDGKFEVEIEMAAESFYNLWTLGFNGYVVKELAFNDYDRLIKAIFKVRWGYSKYQS